MQGQGVVLDDRSGVLQLSLFLFTRNVPGGGSAHNKCGFTVFQNVVHCQGERLRFQLGPQQESTGCRGADSCAAAPQLFVGQGVEEGIIQVLVQKAELSARAVIKRKQLDDGPIPPRFGVEFVSRATDGKAHAKGDFRVLLLSNQAQRSTRDGQGQCLRRLLALVPS